MNNNSYLIERIILEEFSKLIENIEQDFKINFEKKRHNFLLNQLDKKLTANMVFVSSFESKSGFAIEACAKRIARLKFGNENVPTIVNPRNISHNIDSEKINGQIIITDIDINNPNLHGEISTFRTTNIAYGRGKNRVESKTNQESIKKLLDEAKKYKTDYCFYWKPVDLAFFDGENWNLLELKAGGDLDSSNAPSNIEKLLTIYAGLNIENSKIYFATLYNKNGESNSWTGAAKKHLAFPDMFLIGKKFWDKILPEDIDFYQFTNLYKETLEKIDFNTRINKLIDNIV